MELIVPLPVPNTDTAIKHVTDLKEVVTCFAVGQDFMLTSPDMTPIRCAGPVGKPARIFCMLNIWDDPCTVFDAVKTVSKRHGAYAVSANCHGGLDMLKAAMAAAKRAKKELSLQAPRTLVLGSTVPPVKGTQMSYTEMCDHIYPAIDLAKEANLDGLIVPACSVNMVRAACGNNFLIVATEWPVWAWSEDQESSHLRIEAGADFHLIYRGDAFSIEAALAAVKARTL